MTPAPRPRPSVVQWLGYAVGRPLPPELREWVRHDLAGPHAVTRHLVRGMLPYLVVFVVMLALVRPFYLAVLMVLMSLLLSGFYTVAFMDQNRYRRLEVNGLPPDLPRARERRVQEDAREAYERTYRDPRP